MDGVATPIEALAVAVGGVEGDAQFFDALLRSTQTEYALDIGSYGWC